MEVYTGCYGMRETVRQTEKYIDGVILECMSGEWRIWVGGGTRGGGLFVCSISRSVRSCNISSISLVAR